LNVFENEYPPMPLNDGTTVRDTRNDKVIGVAADDSGATGQAT